MIEYILSAIIILLVIVILILVRKEHFSISDIYEKCKDKITSYFNNDEDNDDVVISAPILESERDDNEEVENEVEKEIEEIENDIVKKYSSEKQSTFFTPTLFHPDYVDVINVINSMSNSPNTRIFNKDNKRTVNVDGDDDTIETVGIVCDKFIENVNERIIKQPKSIVEVLNTNRWDNQPETSYVDGFERVRASLGLPKKLYNTSVSGNKVEMVNYSDVNVEKVIDGEDELYCCDITIKRDGSRDKMLFKFKFVLEEGRVVIDEIDVIGFNNDRGVSADYKAVDDYYQYKNLNLHNITSVGDILSSMKDKYLVKEKMMQDNIENLHPEDKLMNMRINPYQYDSLKATRTVYDDIWNKPMFE